MLTPLTRRERSVLRVPSLALALAGAGAVAGITTPAVHLRPSIPVSTLSAVVPVAATAGCRMAPRVHSGWTRFGTTLSAAGGADLRRDLSHEESRFGRLAAVRVYDPALPPADAWSRRIPALGRRTIITSFRVPPRKVLAGSYDSRLKEFFASAPQRGRVFWSYYHEPEPAIRDHQFTAASYRRAFRHIARLARRACHNNLFPTLILTGWTAEAGSHRSWKTYYPGKRYVSVLAWDPYNDAHGHPRSYRKPSHLFAPEVKASAAAGKPMGIAETGSALVPGDAGKGRAAWLRDTGRFLSRHHAVFATYFQSNRNGRFELVDRKSVRAWRVWVQRQS